MSDYIFDPVGALVEGYLDDVLDVPARVQLPKTLPSKFVKIVSVGGTEGVVSQHPMVSFYCWDVSMAKAARFASEVMAHMKSCRSLGDLPVYRVRTVGLPVHRPDESGADRYQFTLELHVRGRNFTP